MTRSSAEFIDMQEDAIFRARGRALLDVIEASQTNPGSGPSYTGVWSTLNREGVNRLIRVLRRARDQAYGRDE